MGRKCRRGFSSQENCQDKGQVTEWAGDPRADQSGPEGIEDKWRGFWERWLSICVRTEKDISPKDF